MHRLQEMDTKNFNMFKKKTIQFEVENIYLLHQNNKNVQMRQVVDDLVKQRTIL